MDEIRLAYRRLASFYHPDKNPGDAHAAQMFRHVLDAYRRLSDSSRMQSPGLPAPYRRVCRRKKRGTPTDRRFNWQLPAEYKGTQVEVEV